MKISYLALILLSLFSCNSDIVDAIKDQENCTNNSNYKCLNQKRINITVLKESTPLKLVLLLNDFEIFNECTQITTPFEAIRNSNELLLNSTSASFIIAPTKIELYDLGEDCNQNSLYYSSLHNEFETTTYNNLIDITID